MVYRYVWDNGHDLTIQVNPMINGLLIFMFGFESNGYFVIGAPCLNGGHGCGRY
jgi:hypothetical protein